MNKILAAVFAFSFPFLSGCTTIVSDRIASGVDAYCASTNEEDQQAIRQRIESRTDHKIRVECAR